MVSYNGAGSQTYGGDDADTIATQSGSIGYGGAGDNYREVHIGVAGYAGTA